MGRMRDNRPVCLHSASNPAEDKEAEGESSAATGRLADGSDAALCLKTASKRFISIFCEAAPTQPEAAPWERSPSRSAGLSHPGMSRALLMIINGPVSSLLITWALPSLCGDTVHAEALGVWWPAAFSIRNVLCF